MHKLAERTYVNADSTAIVAEGSPDAAFLLGNEGDEISVETAARLGLTAEDQGDYASMKVADLKALAETRGVEIPSDAKKADIVEALEDADGEAASTTEEGGTAQVESPVDA